MTIGTACDRAESLAGAIALGEASAAEREQYRLHLAHCARCVEAYGGERNIERVMAVVARARDDERWEPVARARMPHRVPIVSVARWSAVAATAALFAFALTSPPGVTDLHRARNGAAAIAALNTQIPPRRVEQTESLVYGSATTSKTAALFELGVDRDGQPKSCRIVRSSGFSRLDAAVCRAAMQSRASHR